MRNNATAASVAAARASRQLNSVANTAETAKPVSTNGFSQPAAPPDRRAGEGAEAARSKLAGQVDFALPSARSFFGKAQVSHRPEAQLAG